MMTPPVLAEFFDLHMKHRTKQAKDIMLGSITQPPPSPLFISDTSAAQNALHNKLGIQSTPAMIANMIGAAVFRSWTTTTF